MKYLNILAGAFGLMALAACTNDDEVTTVEQSKEVRTITVAYNQGADTRYEITLDDASGDPPYYTYEYSKGFKVKWTSGDKIALIKDGTKYTFETQESGEVATFTLVSGKAPSLEGDYKVVFPADWDGNLDNFQAQDVDADFNPEKYLYSTATATLTDGEFGTTNLTPVFSYIFIPEEGVRFWNMVYWGFEERTEYKPEEDYDNAGTLNMNIYLKGTNLYNKIVNFEGEYGDVDHIELSNLTIWKYGNTWTNVGDRLIAIPVFEGKPISNIVLDFGGIECKVSKKDGSALTIDRGGVIYRLADDRDAKNLQFDQILPEVGQLIGSDGRYYATKTAAEAAGAKAEALILSLDEDTGYGMAIALEDVSNELYTYNNTGENNHGENAEGIVAEWAESHSIKTINEWDGWYLPNEYCWQPLFEACGGTKGEGNAFSYGTFREKLIDAGGNDVKDGNYWGYTRNPDGLKDRYWGYDFANSTFAEIETAYIRAYFGFTYKFD